MIKYKRKSGSIIELKDTPEMKEFAEKNGFIKIVDKPKKQKAVNNDRKGG